MESLLSSSYEVVQALDLNGPPNNLTPAASSEVGEPTGGWTHVAPSGWAQWAETQPSGVRI